MRRPSAPACTAATSSRAASVSATRPSVVGRQQDRLLDEPGGMPAGTPPSKCDMRAGGHTVVPAVEVADEADHLWLAGEGARQPQRQMRGFGAGGREAHALGAGDQTVDQLRPSHFQLVRGAPVRAERHLPLDRPPSRQGGSGRAAARRGRRSSRRTRCHRRPTCADPRRGRRRSDRATGCGCHA